jgi:flavin reductase (DIM6/NTAB) family NADH-FMN oxidoreductase RutF
MKNMDSTEEASRVIEALDPMRFRKTVSLFATGIAIITCEDDGGQVHGMTINSFTSISLDPPTVLISLKPGKAHRLITRSGRFGASILNEGQQHFSSHFSGRPQEVVPDFMVRHRVPTLRQCLAWFECEISEKVQVNDHTLFLARVVQCDGIDGSPLMFFGSKYHRPVLAGAAG